MERLCSMCIVWLSCGLNAVEVWPSSVVGQCVLFGDHIADGVGGMEIGRSLAVPAQVGGYQWWLV
jgi:hypothetical protein